MCPSTCASSVETRLREVQVEPRAHSRGHHHDADEQQAAPAIRRGIARWLRLVGPFLYRTGHSSVGHCTELPCSVSPCVQASHLAGGAREVGARLVVAVERPNLVVIGAGKLVLRRNHFDVVGDAGAEAVLRLRDVFRARSRPGWRRRPRCAPIPAARRRSSPPARSGWSRPGAAGRASSPRVSARADSRPNAAAGEERESRGCRRMIGRNQRRAGVRP